MYRKIRNTIALAALLAILRGIAAAGPVQIGMLSSSRSDDWLCGAEVLLSAPNSKSWCENAKFGECSECGVLAVRNQSTVPVKLSIKTIGSGFAQPCSPGAIGGFMKCDSGESVPIGNMNECGGSLEPGKRCTLPIEFCPEHAGKSHGEVRVSASSGSGQHDLEIFSLAGTADYPPDLAAADEAMRSRLGALMKLAYVKKVELDRESGGIAINIEVTEDERIGQVRSLIPPKIGGYRTEVTTYSPIFCAE
jgi:hypothetical protein